MNKLKMMTTKIAPLALTLTAVASTSVFAAETGYTPPAFDASVLTNAIGTTVTNTITMFSALVPIGLAIFGAKFAWVKGVQFFSKLAANHG